MKYICVNSNRRHWPKPEKHTTMWSCRIKQERLMPRSGIRVLWELMSLTRWIMWRLREMSPAFREICRCRSGVHAVFQRRTLILRSIFLVRTRMWRRCMPNWQDILILWKILTWTSCCTDFSTIKHLRTGLNFIRQQRVYIMDLSGVCWNIPSAWQETVIILRRIIRFWTGIFWLRRRFSTISVN